MTRAENERQIEVSLGAEQLHPMNVQRSADLPSTSLTNVEQKTQRVEQNCSLKFQVVLLRQQLFMAIYFKLDTTLRGRSLKSKLSEIFRDGIMDEFFTVHGSSS